MIFVKQKKKTIKCVKRYRFQKGWISNNIKDKINNQALQKQRSYRIVIISCEL